MGSCVSKPTASGAAAPTTDALLDLQQRLAAAEEQLCALRLAQAQVEQQQQFKDKEKEQEKLQRPEQSRALVVAAATNGAGAPGAAPPLDAQSPAPPRVSDASGHSGAAAPPTPPARQGSGGALAQALSAVAVPPAPPSAVPLPAAVPMETTRIVMNRIVAPSECDGLGICTGGQVLSWIDVCAGLSAKTLARGPCVTISVDAVHFIRPCRLGQVVIVAAMVNRTFSSSMEVGVRVEAEDMRTGVRYHCCSAYLTFVSLRGRAQRGAAAAAAASAAAATTPAAALVAQDSKSRPLPRIVPAGPEQQATYEQAEGRRQARLARRQSLASDPRRAEEVENSRLRPVTHREGCPTLPPPLTLLPATLDGRANGEKARVSPAATTAYMTQSIMPQHANTLGITFGGQVMSWMEQCAYISASRLRGLRHLTAGMDSVTLARTTKVGDVLYVTAQVTAIFNSSLEVAVTVFGETPSEGAVFHCADACVTVVVVDEGGAPSSIPFALDPQTPNQQLRYRTALRRRRERLAMRHDLLKEAAAKKLLDGSLTRMSSHGSCNVLSQDLAASAAAAAAAASARASMLAAGGAAAGCGGARPFGGFGAAASGFREDGGAAGARAIDILAVVASNGASKTLGVCPSPKLEGVFPIKSGQRSAPVSPKGQLRQQLRVGSVPSPHEYFDNW